MTLDDIAERWIDWAVNEPRVRALWVEAEDIKSLRRPYVSLCLHLTADEPEYPSVLQELSRGEAQLGIPGLKIRGIHDTQRFAKELVLEADGNVFTVIAEQSYLLAKRPRSAVVPLVDKTGHLPHVLDYSAKKGP